jgi:hypothetical protein
VTTGEFGFCEPGIASYNRGARQQQQVMQEEQQQQQQQQCMP